MTPTLRCAAAALVALAAGAAATASSAAPSPAPKQDQVPVFGARVEVVRLHAAVLDDAGPVVDLTAADFVVVDNGVEHQVALALTPTETPIDVALVFDQSDSIRQGAPTVKRDARAFLDALGPEDCAFVLPFQHRVGPGVWGPSLAPTLLQTIDLAPLEGGTSFNDALIVGLSEVQRWNIPAALAERVLTEYRQPTIEGGVGINFGAEEAPEPEPAPDTAGFDPTDLPLRVFASSYGCGGSGAQERRKALVVLTDGVDTTSMNTFGELLAFVSQTDVPVFPVAIGHPGSRPPSEDRDRRTAARLAEGRLKRLAEATGGNYVEVSGSELQLREAYDEIITVLRGSYLLGYYPQRAASPALAAGGVVHEHEVEVRVRRPGLKVFVRTDYYRAAGDTHTARAALRRGAALALDGRAAEALTEARAATAADPSLWDGSFLEAAALWMEGRLQEALPPLQRTLRLAPGVASAHFLAWQLHFDLGNDAAAWQQAIRAQIAGADMEEPMRLLTARSTPPAALDIRLAAPRVLVEGPRGEDPEAYARLAGLSRELSRVVSVAPYLGLVRDPLAADYYLYIDAEEVDRQRPGALASRLEFYNYAGRRLWREDMDVADLGDAEQVAAAVQEALTQLGEWLRESR